MVSFVTLGIKKISCFFEILNANLGVKGIARKKQKSIGIRTTNRRAEILKAYLEMTEKTQTQVIEDFIDSLEEKVNKRKTRG